MKDHAEMATLSYILDKLRQKGFDNELVISEKGEMVCEKLGKRYGPEDLLVFKNFRFEGETNPDDSSILLMVEDRDGDIGYILDSYGAYSSHDGPEFDDFVRKIPTDERDNEELFS